MEYGKKFAEKIDRTIKIKKHTKQTEKKKTTIQGNIKANTRKPSKTKYKGKSKQKINKGNKI
jgi:hypothetical protein